MPNLKTNLALLVLLALLWGSSYMLINIAVQDIPPLTLVSVRVSIAALLLWAVMRLRGDSLALGMSTWRQLLLQSFFNSIGAWTVLAWGQQYVDAGLASMLNSTSPLFVFLITAAITRHESTSWLKLSGSVVGIVGVVLIVGVEVLQGLGTQVLAQLACLLGAFFYGCAAVYGKRFNHLSALATATGTLLWASVVLVPLALIVERPWNLAPSLQAISALAVLSCACTALAMLIYFRLVKSLGSMAVSSQAYLRAGVGVLLGVLVLGETISLPVGFGLAFAMLGVVLINFPRAKRA